MSNFQDLTPTADRPASNLSPHASEIIVAIILAIISGTAVLVFCCILFIIWPRSHRARYTYTGTAAVPTVAASTAASSSTSPSDAVSSPSTTSTSSQDSPVITSTSSFEYSVAPHEEKLECSVCLMELRNGQKGRLLMLCGHSFHAECIERWFRLHTTCPLCRAIVVEVERKNVSEPSVV